jgi:hypothetical protein
MVEIAARSDQILFDNENGFMVNIQLTNEQCMELVEHWWNSQDEDTRHDVIESYDYIEGFLANFIDFLENYLNHQLEGWQERRYGYEG